MFLLIVLVATAACAVGIDSVAAQAATGSFSTENVPSTAGADSVSGTSCVSPTFCMAVGFFFDGAVYQPRAEEWDGYSWSTMTTAKPAEAAPFNSSEFTGVSCVSTSYCVAVGDYLGPNDANQAFAEEWNGSSWSTTIMPSPDVGSIYLAAVSCASPTFCVAVGQSSAFAEGVVEVNGPTAALAEEWNGAAWSIMATDPQVTASTQVQNPGALPAPTMLIGVSCLSATFCMTVGSYGQLTLAEAWNGSTWSATTTANPGGASSTDYLDGVSCPSSGLCLAVGFSNNSTLAEKWNGSSWATTTTTNPGGSSNYNELLGISCPNCTRPPT